MFSGGTYRNILIPKISTINYFIEKLYLKEYLFIKKITKSCTYIKLGLYFE